MRFSIRDLLWATLAMGLGWWGSYRAVEAKCRKAVFQTQRHRLILNDLKASGLNLLQLAEPGEPMWDVLHEPLVEP